MCLSLEKMGGKVSKKRKTRRTGFYTCQEDGLVCLEPPRFVESHANLNINQHGLRKVLF